jgi:hypothetical protein
MALPERPFPWGRYSPKPGQGLARNTMPNGLDKWHEYCSLILIHPVLLFPHAARPKDKP